VATSSSTAIPVVSKNLRKHLRFKIEDAATDLQIRGLLTVLGLGRANKARATINLSEGGALILAGERLSVGTKVHLRIEMERYKDAIESEGQVRWCFESAREAQRYYVGLAFTNLDPLQEKKIAQMREWFRSPEYKARKAVRKQDEPPNIEWVT
jgi:c-di-GMP-binding flagellar brake protein YcgR